MVTQTALPQGRFAAARSNGVLLRASDLWGAAMIAPYVLIFAVFVLYPVAYGFWLARHPMTYVALAKDPIFLRTVFNTIVFLAVAINLKMLLALVLSGFFIQPRWWIKLLLLV